MDYVIIVAGGKGLRMGSDIPKQFLPIGGKPVLMRTIERFREYSATLQIILVLPEAQQAYWRELCQQYNFPLPANTPLPCEGTLPASTPLPCEETLPASTPLPCEETLPASTPLPSKGGVRGGSYLLANGGATRFHSVQNGLALIPDDAQGVVGVHDGVRPFPSIDVIRCCYETARETGAVIPVIPVVETLRHITLTSNLSPLTSKTVPRGDYRLVQTPQTFDIQLLKAANRQLYNDGFTDDASVVEAFGHAITLVDGNRENIKITTPYDLKVAEILI